MKHRYRSSYSQFISGVKHQPLLIVAGAFLLATFQVQPTSALTLDMSGLEVKSFSIQPTINTKPVEPPKSPEQIIAEGRAEVERLRKEAEEKENSLKEVKETNTSLSKSIQKLQDEIKSKEDMFVHIKRYLPGSGGNGYVPGNCTWYVKSKRPDIGNFWGDAHSWLASAQADGFETGSKAKIGAIAVSFEGYYGHVAYVEKITPQGIVISEMNYGALYAMNTRTVSESEFKYIYALP